MVVLSLCGATAQTASPSTDEEIFSEYVSTMDSSLPIGELMVRTALFFQGRPFVGATLETEPERLVTNLRELDCMTLVETTLALTRTEKDPVPTFDGFKKHLQEIRYRNGIITDYTDRLHYTTDWVYENERKGIVKDMTEEIGGKPFEVNVYFMSSNPSLYKQLKDSPKRVEYMRKKENEIRSRKYFYIPQDSIDTLKKNVRNGDIIGFTTHSNGLDITHVAIAYWLNDELTFVHASSAKKKVIINPESLAEYTKRIKNNDGIIIVRATDK
jgi:hypothetical protein